jgi:RNA polymerase sigma-70 factor (ECF subfamily)
VKTVPQAGTADVDPATSELRVTFRKEMADGYWSWNKASEGAFPKLTGPPRYEKDRRTCVAPVKLEPGKTYAVWLNSPAAQSFRDRAGRSAVPYLLVFATRGNPRVKATWNDPIAPPRRPPVAVVRDQ